MTTTQEIIAQQAKLDFYENLYIKRIISAIYEPDWLDITKYLLFASASAITKKLDFNIYGYSQKTTDSAKFSLDNNDGAFNRAGQVYSLFVSADKRHYTKIKYVAGYKDADGVKITENIFEGLINEKTISSNFNTGIIDLEALAYDIVLAETTIVTFTPTDATTLALSTALVNAEDSRIYVNTLSPITIGDYIYVAGDTTEEYKIDDKDTDDTGAFIRIKPTLVNTLSSGTAIVKNNYNKTIAEVVKTICDNESVTKYINYDASLINPYFNYAIDNAKYYDNKKSSEIITDICQKSSSIWYIDNNNKLNIRSKTIDNSLTTFEFIGGYAQSRNNNILVDGITLFDDGYNSIINQVNYSNDTLEISFKDINANTDLYGTTILDLKGDDILNQTTIASICNNIIQQEGIPKRRIGIKTAYMPNVIEYFQPVTIDYKPALKVMPNNIKPLVWNADAYFNSDYYWHVYENQLILNDNEKYKYYGCEHNTSDMTTTHYILLT
jgi:hypothetical protein